MRPPCGPWPTRSATRGERCATCEAATAEATERRPSGLLAVLLVAGAPLAGARPPVSTLCLASRAFPCPRRVLCCVASAQVPEWMLSLKRDKREARRRRLSQRVGAAADAEAEERGGAGRGARGGGGRGGGGARGRGGGRGRGGTVGAGRGEGPAPRAREDGGRGRGRGRGQRRGRGQGQGRGRGRGASPRGRG
jgi:hypothetical protein